METRANYAIVGLFTLAVLAGAFGFVYWFSGRDKAGQRVAFDIAFDGSVSGLSRGSSVLFNGLRKGEVTAIRLDPTNPQRVIATIAVDADTPVRGDTEAKLEFQGLTGIASVQLSGGKPDAAALSPGKPGESPVIVAKRSDFQDILSTVQKLAIRADDLLARADKLIADNEGSVGRSLRNVESFTDALAKNADGVNRFLSSTAGAADKIAALSTSIEAIVQAIEPGKIGKIVADIETVTGTFAANKAEIDTALKEIAGLGKRLNDIGTKVEAVFADAGAVVKAIDPARLSRSLENADRFIATLGDNSGRIDSAIKDIASLSGRADRFMATLDQSRDDVTAMLKDAAGLARRLNDAAPKLDAALADIGAVAKALDPLKVGRVVDNVDRVTQMLGDNRERFNTALKDFASIAERADRFVATLDQSRAEVTAMLKDGASLVKRLNDSAPKLDAVLADIGAFTRAFDPTKVGRLVDNVDRFAQALGDNKEQVDKVLKEASSITGKLDVAAGKLDAVLTAAQNLLGSVGEGEGKGFIAELTDAAKAIRVLALNLDGRTAEITAGIGRFTGPALRDYQALAVDGRRTLGDIQRAIRSLEKNPQQLILGGRPPIPEFQGRR